MNLPLSVKDAVIEDFAQHLVHSNQSQNVEKKLAILTGKDKVASRIFSELENFINDQLSSDLASADAEMDLFLTRKSFSEKAFSYFRNKIVAEELIEQFRVLHQETLEPNASICSIETNEKQPIFLSLIHTNVNFLLQEKNNTGVSPFSLTSKETESLKQAVVNRTGVALDKLRNILFMKIPENNRGELSENPQHIDNCIKESLAESLNTKAQSLNALFQSLYILANILKDLNELLLVWNKSAISCGDSKVLKIRRLCIQLETSFKKLQLLKEKLLREIYDLTNLKTLKENQEYLNIKYSKLLTELDKIRSDLQKYLKNRSALEPIALEYRKTVEAIREREEEIKYLERLHN